MYVMVMVEFVSRSVLATVVTAVAFSHSVSAARSTSHWTPGNVGNWSGAAAADGLNRRPPALVTGQTFSNKNITDTYSVIIGSEVREPHMLVLMMLGLTVIVWMHRRQANVTLH